MDNFWANISRYPRFFISSLFGLILIIIAPFKNLFKKSKLKLILIIIFLILLFILYQIIKSMTNL